MESWNFHTLVFAFPHPSSARSCHELADSGINTGTHPSRSHRHSSDFDVQRLCDLVGLVVTLSLSFSRLLLLDTIGS